MISVHISAFVLLRTSLANSIISILFVIPVIPVLSNDAEGGLPFPYQAKF